MITDVNGKNPVHVHRLIIVGLQQHIHTGKNQRNGDGGKPNPGRRDIVYQESKNTMKKPGKEK